MRCALARAAAALSLALCLGAAAPDTGIFETEYLITDEVVDKAYDERPLERGVIVFQQRLSFANLATGDVALTLEDGRVVVPAGEQYFRAASEGPEVWCTANMRMPGDTVGNALIGRVYPQYCIYDSDKDGAYDRFFKKQRTIEAMPNVRGRLPGGLRPITPMRLTRIDPKALRTSYYIGVQFVRTGGKEPKAPFLQMYAGSESGMFYIAGWIAGTPGAKQRVSIADAIVEISTTPEGVTGRLIKPFGVGPTRIKGTNCGWINGC